LRWPETNRTGEIRDNGASLADTDKEAPTRTSLDEDEGNVDRLAMAYGDDDIEVEEDLRGIINSARDLNLNPQAAAAAMLPTISLPPQSMLPRAYPESNR